MWEKFRAKEKLELAKKVFNLKAIIEPIKCDKLIPKQKHQFKKTDIEWIYICKKCKVLKIID